MKILVRYSIQQKGLKLIYCFTRQCYVMLGEKDNEVFLEPKSKTANELFEKVVEGLNSRDGRN